MLDTLSSPGMAPFTFAFFALIGLMLVELLLMLLGLSSDLGLGETDLPEPGAAPAEVPHLPDSALAELDLSDAGLGADPGMMPGVAAAAPEGAVVPILRALGLGDAPAMVWLAALAAAFAISGFALQGLVSGLFGAPLAPLPAALLALGPALFAARGFARMIGRLLPSVESYGTSSFHRRLGRITVGVARAGYPAEVRYLDSYGTSHQLMAEPLDRDDSLPAGTEVIILRDRSGKPRLVRTT